MRFARHTSQDMSRTTRARVRTAKRTFSRSGTGAAPPTGTTRSGKMNEENAAAAAKLERVGMSVVVIDDFGKPHLAVLDHQPWQLGHGAWVCHAGRFRAYDCSRVHPMPNE